MFVRPSPWGFPMIGFALLLCVAVAAVRASPSSSSNFLKAAHIADYSAGNTAVGARVNVFSAPSSNASMEQWAAQHTAAAVEVAKYFLTMRHADCVISRVLRVTLLTHCFSRDFPMRIAAGGEDASRKGRGKMNAGTFSDDCDVFVDRHRATTPLLLSNVTEVIAELACEPRGGAASRRKASNDHHPRQKRRELRIAAVSLHLESIHGSGGSGHPREYGEQLDALLQRRWRSGIRGPAGVLQPPDIVSPMLVSIYQPHGREQGADGGREDSEVVLPDPATAPPTADPASGANMSSGQQEATTQKIPFRLLNFNIWNYNGDWGKRLARFHRIMKDLLFSRTRFVAEFGGTAAVGFGLSSPPSALPHVITLQEVRYHNHFRAPAGQPPSTLRTRLQAWHLWQSLTDKYNAVHHPSMTYMRIDRGLQIESEGPMIMQLLQGTPSATNGNIGINDENQQTTGGPDGARRRPAGSAAGAKTCPAPSSSLPAASSAFGPDQDEERGAARTAVELVATVPLRLTRLGRDGDDHQRMLLCAVYTVKASPSIDPWDERLSLRVDVCTSHFSLASDAQLLNAVEVVNLTAGLASQRHFNLLTAPDGLLGIPAAMRVATRTADVTIFAGDLNALPEATCITHLLRPQSDGGGGFRDAFYTVVDGTGEGVRPTASRCRIRDPQRISDFSFCNGLASEGEEDGLTFDANAENLRKRIDFVLYKAWGWERQSGDGEEGREWWWDVDMRSLCRLGCKSAAEGTAASDHLALLADMDFVRRGRGSRE